MILIIKCTLLFIAFFGFNSQLFAVTWPTGHPSNAIYAQLKQGYGSSVAIYDSYFWWSSDGYLWQEVTPITSRPLVCGGDLDQNGVISYYFLVTSSGNAFCDNLSGSQVFMIYAEEDKLSWGGVKILHDGYSELYDKVVDIPSPLGSAPAKKFRLTINRTGNGTVTGNYKTIWGKKWYGLTYPWKDSQLNCGDVCTVLLERDSEIELKAESILSSNYMFDSWSSSECINKHGLSCSFVLDRDITININFSKKNPDEPESPPYQAIGKQKMLIVTKKGEGIVNDSTNRIYCGSRCSASFNKKSRVLLTVQPAKGWMFVGWRGACGWKTACVVKMKTRKKVKAIFVNVGDNDDNPCTIGNIRICNWNPPPKRMNER